MSNNRDDDKGDYKRSRIAEMMKHRFLGGGPVEPPDVDYSERIIMLHGEKARGVSTYEMGRGPGLMDYGLTWVGWLEKYSSYAKREGEGTPIFQQTIVEELMRADADARAQGTWLEDEQTEEFREHAARAKERARRARERQMYILRDDDDED